VIQKDDFRCICSHPANAKDGKSKDGKDGKSSLKDGKDIKSLLNEFLSIFLLESTDPEHLAGLITHIEFEGEQHALNFPLYGVLLVKNEIMKVEHSFAGYVIMGYI
jgi:hypothetical protein